MRISLMSAKKNLGTPLTIYMTFGVVAAVSLIMSTFIGAGMALWYPALIKPDWSIPLPFTFIIRIFMAVMFGFLLYYTYTLKTTFFDKWFGFFYAFGLFFCNELFYVLFYELESTQLYFFSLCTLLLLSVGLLIFLILKNRRAIWCLIPYFLWLFYLIPWAFTLWKLNA